MTAPTLMILDPSDTVAVVLTDMAEGEIREGLTARAAIPRGHKIARSAMAAGSPVLKYGQVMAVAIMRDCVTSERPERLDDWKKEAIRSRTASSPSEDSGP